jgi:hypothetical protein
MYNRINEIKLHNDRHIGSTSIAELHCPKSSANFREIPRSVYGSKSPGRQISEGGLTLLLSEISQSN